MTQMAQADRPNVIFLDAVGTLFGVRDSVGANYAQVAQRHGVTVAPDRLDRAFFASFRAASPPAFTQAEPTAIREQEFQWWRAIAAQTFQRVDQLAAFADFDAFFADLYAYFATAEPWFVYPDVLTALRHWQTLNIQLGILSNFDSRIYAVLDALQLAPYFASVTISTEVGAAKPDPQIFAIALEKHLCPAVWAWHIGDRYDEDYQAARAAGLRGIWLRRAK